MPRVTWTQNNFNAGEWSPLTYGRSDLAKYKNALAQCLNYVPTTQGGLTRRPGTRYVASVKNSANAVRLVRFEFSTTQAYVLEFGPLYIRFYTNDGQLLSGGSPYEVTTTYAAGDLATLSFTQSADVLYIAHPSYPPAKLVRNGATSWTLSTISFVDGPYLIVNPTSTTLTITGVTGAQTVTASSTTGINGGLGFQASDVGRPLRIKCGANWQWGTITAYTDSTHVTWTIVPPTSSALKTTATGTVATSLANLVISGSVTNGGGGYIAAPNATISPVGAGSGATATTTISGGAVVAINITNNGSGYTTGATIAIDSPTAATPGTTVFWRLGAWGGGNGYPGSVTFHQDRLLWGGSTAYPNRIDGSNVSDYENMSPTNVDGTVVDSNAVSFSLNSNSVSTINWMISDEWGLLVGATTGEWVIAASGTQAALTPTNVNAKQTSKYGTTSVIPEKMGKSTLFVQRAKRKLREMTYQFTLGTFQAPDISLTGEHLTKSGIKQMAAQLAPQTILWMVTNNGVLVGMIYDKDQEIVGWHQHQLGGYSDAGQTAAPVVESVATIPAPDGTRDEVWVSVQRYINGSVVRYIEVLTKFWEDGDAVADAVYVDSSAAYSGASTTTVSGLTWLKGQTVSVLADGATHPTCVVDSSGVITLSRAATKVQVGLGYTSSGKTMRIEAGGQDGQAQGKLKRIHRAIFRFFQSVGLTLSSNATGAPSTPEPFRTSADLMDNPVGLYTGDKRWAFEGSYELEGQVIWSQPDPLPSNILLIAAQMETQDGG